MNTIPMPDFQISAIAPEITLTLVAITLLLLEVFSTSKGKDHFGYVAVGGVVIATALTCGMKGESFTTFSGLYTVDNFSTFFKLITLLATGLTVLISIDYIRREGVDNGEYYALLLFASVGMLFMVSGSDMITIYMGLEVMSICLYALAGYTRSRESANEASLKYFILGSFSSGFLLYGMGLVYGVTGSTNLTTIGAAIEGGIGNQSLLVMGAIFIMIGFLFKISAVPFHMWAPDVYQGAPAPVTAFMSAGPKAAAFAAFIRILAEAFPSMHGEWGQVLWVLAVLTMTLGNLMAIQQNSVKRMLAYSSISHAGYILIGLVAASERATSGVLFYLLAYTFMNIAAFAIIGVVSGKNEERSTFADFTGIGYRYPLLALTMTIMLLSLAGIPPTAGFVGKFYIFMAAIEEQYYYLAIIGVINSVISVYYYLKLTVYMYLKEGSASETNISFAPSFVVALALSVYGVLWIGMMPGGYVAFAKSAFLSF